MMSVSISVNIWSQLLLLQDTLEAFFKHDNIFSCLSLDCCGSALSSFWKKSKHVNGDADLGLDGL